MSLLDQLRALEDQVSKRITELRPAVAEFDELRKVADRLGLSDRLGLTHGDTADSETAPQPDAATTADATATTETAAASGREAKAPGTRRRPKASDRSATRARVGSSGASTKAETRRRSATSASATATARDATASNGTTRERGAARQQEILEAVRANPGMTVAELAKHVGVAATNLYRPIKRLQDSGALTKTGTKLTAREEAKSGG